MPDNTNRTPFQIAWLDFTKGVIALLVPQADDRPLDQYIQFRNSVIVLVQSETLLFDLNKAGSAPTLNPDIQKALIEELQAFPRAVEAAQTVGKPDETKGWWRRMLDRASTTVGSVQDLLDKLPWYAKGTLTLFKELIDLFKAKD